MEYVEIFSLIYCVSDCMSGQEVRMLLLKTRCIEVLISLTLDRLGDLTFS